MAGKAVKLINISGGTSSSIGGADTVYFIEGFLVAIWSNLSYQNYYPAQGTLQRVEIGPEGATYPGDASVGDGPKKLTINFNFATADHVLNRCDAVELKANWCIATKGEWLIGFSRHVIDVVQVLPST